MERLKKKIAEARNQREADAEARLREEAHETLREEFPIGWGVLTTKRFLDIVVALTILIVYCKSYWTCKKRAMAATGSAFYIQPRIGYLGNTTLVTKFQTMVKDVVMLPDERTSRRDELAGLWDVLRGDASIIGWRQVLKEHFEQCQGMNDARRYVLTFFNPGMFGWGQLRKEGQNVQFANFFDDFERTARAHSSIPALIGEYWHLLNAARTRLAAGEISDKSQSEKSSSIVQLFPAE